MTRQQRWAQLAFEAVSAQKGTPEESKFATYCMRGPTLLRQSGLVQSLAFLHQKDEMAQRYVESIARALGNDGDAKALLAKAKDTPELASYVALSRDAVGFAVWLRRFAQSELKTEEP